MYTYVNAVVEYPNRSVAEVDVANVTFRSLKEQYREVYLNLYNTITYTAPYCCQLSAIYFDVVDEMTVSEWLVHIGNKTLPTAYGFAGIRLRQARFGDATNCGYLFAVADMGTALDSGQALEERDDLLLTHPKWGITGLANNAMITINGLFHFPSASPNGCYLANGGRTVNHTQSTDVGILDFSEIGTLQYLPIKAEMIHRGVTTIPLYHTAYVTFTEVISEKIPILSLFGFLLLPNQHFQVVNDHTIAIDLNALSLIDKFFIAQHVLELPPFPNTTFSDHIKKSTFVSDAFMVYLLTLPQSFLVLVDATNLRQSVNNTEHIGFPGRYRCTTEPYGLLRLANGLTITYKATLEYGEWTLCCKPYTAQRYFELNPESMVYMRRALGDSFGKVMRAESLSLYNETIEIRN